MVTDRAFCTRCGTETDHAPFIAYKLNGQVVEVIAAAVNCLTCGLETPMGPDDIQVIG